MTNATQITINDIVQLLRKREWTDIADGIERGEAAWYTDDDETTVTAAYDYAIHKIDHWSSGHTGERYLSDALSDNIHGWNEAEAVDTLDWWITEYESVMAYESAMEDATDDAIMAAGAALELTAESPNNHPGDDEAQRMRAAINDYVHDDSDFEPMQRARASVIAAMTQYS